MEIIIKKVSSICTSMLTQGRLESTEPNLMHFKGRWLDRTETKLIHFQWTSMHLHKKKPNINWIFVRSLLISIKILIWRTIWLRFWMIFFFSMQFRRQSHAAKAKRLSLRYVKLNACVIFTVFLLWLRDGRWNRKVVNAAQRFSTQRSQLRWNFIRGPKSRGGRDSGGSVAQSSVCVLSGKASWQEEDTDWK